MTLFGLAISLIKKAGISEEDAFAVLKPLVEGTLLNIEKAGVHKALTGPIARGDVGTVKKHLQEMASAVPQLLQLYKALGLSTVDIALTSEALSENTARELEELLKD